MRIGIVGAGRIGGNCAQRCPFGRKQLEVRIGALEENDLAVTELRHASTPETRSGSSKSVPSSPGPCTTTKRVRT
jgi:predicted dinucleotide-binding enzyme